MAINLEHSEVVADWYNWCSFGCQKVIPTDPFWVW